MPDTNNGSTTGQAPDGTTGQAPTQPNGQAPGGTSQNPNQQNSNSNSNSQNQGQGQNQGQANGNGTGDISPTRLAELLAEARQEAAAHRIEANRLKEAQRVADENKLAAEKQFEQLANKRAETIKELEAKIAGFERKETINQILAAHKLPLDLAVAITGTTKEEMEASAKILAKHVVAPPAPNTEGGQNQQKKSSQGTGNGQGHGQQNQSQRRYGFQAPNEVSWPI